MTEIWKPIEGYEEYEISSCGNVRSNKHGVVKPRKLNTNHKGYLVFGVCKNGIEKKLSVARCVGIAFIPNPDVKPQIDHINRNKKDNRVENLRWVSFSENQINKPYKNITTGHRYITRRDLRYVFEVKRFKIYQSFPTLQEALNARAKYPELIITL